jgi:hypothetical protein
MGKSTRDKIHLKGKSMRKKELKEKINNLK